MSMLLSMMATLALMNAGVEKDHAEKLDKNWTVALDQRHRSTQVDKCQEPAGAGSSIAERGEIQHYSAAFAFFPA